MDLSEKPNVVFLHLIENPDFLDLQLGKTLKQVWVDEESFSGEFVL